MLLLFTSASKQEVFLSGMTKEKSSQVTCETKLRGVKGMLGQVFIKFSGTSSQHEEHSVAIRWHFTPAATVLDPQASSLVASSFSG